MAKDIKLVLSWLEGLTVDDWRDYHSDSEVQNIAKEAFELLKEQEEVVRCKDCKFRFDLHCPLDVDHKQAPEWFCADGERKDSD